MHAFGSVDAEHFCVRTGFLTHAAPASFPSGAPHSAQAAPAPCLRQVVSAACADVPVEPVAAGHAASHAGSTSPAAVTPHASTQPRYVAHVGSALHVVMALAHVLLMQSRQGLAA